MLSYMAEHLLKYGWEYVVVDIRWFVENDKQEVTIKLIHAMCLMNMGVISCC